MKTEFKEWLLADEQRTIGSLSRHASLALVKGLYSQHARVVEVNIPEDGRLFVTIPTECGVEVMCSLTNYHPDEVSIPQRLQVELLAGEHLVVAWWD